MAIIVIRSFYAFAIMLAVDGAAFQGLIYLLNDRSEKGLWYSKIRLFYSVDSIPKLFFFNFRLFRWSTALSSSATFCGIAEVLWNIYIQKSAEFFFTFRAFSCRHTAGKVAFFNPLNMYFILFFKTISLLLKWVIDQKRIGFHPIQIKRRKRTNITWTSQLNL